MAEKMSWIVYILECSDGSLYTGITTDLSRRITEHEQGNGARYTRGRKPFSLKYTEYFINRGGSFKKRNIDKNFISYQKTGIN